MASRAQNERKFGQWEELPHGGRRYFRDFVGRAGGRARYIKEVDASENTRLDLLRKSMIKLVTS
jgi:hypothetical protein